MKKNNKIVSVLSVSLVSAMMLGCANNAVVPEAEPEPMAMQAAEVAPLSITKIEKPMDTSLPEPGSFRSLVNKLKEGGLFWREKNAYSFHVGQGMGAEYQPGTGLKVIGSADDGAVECNFKKDGSFSGDAKLQETCRGIMFTLDEELD
jgi:hypothetical protein